MLKNIDNKEKINFSINQQSVQVALFDQQHGLFNKTEENIKIRWSKNVHMYSNVEEIGKN